MKLLRDLSAVPESVRGGAVTIGNFDGVHLGHKQIVERLLAQARRCGGPAIVFTFDPHPVRLLRHDQAPPPLTWTDRKAELLEQLGVDTTIAYPTDEALLRLSPDHFFQKIVAESLHARAMVEGTNFYFGRGRTGNIQVLKTLCTTAGIPLEIVDPVLVNGAQVSSSHIRQLISAGSIAEANSMLTQPYRIRGMVRHGAARGAKIGFPTANVDAVDTLLPGLGVYAGRCAVEGRVWPAAINIGPNPTFGEQALKVEVHLIGFSDSLYGQPLEVDFLARLRDIVQFSGVDALKAQLARDVTAASDVFKQFAS
jgi:riboflavin kinase / FMN adenylyltransferase